MLTPVEHSLWQCSLNKTPFGLPDPFDSSCIIFCLILALHPTLGFYYFIGAVTLRLCCVVDMLSPPSSSSSGCSSAVTREPFGGWIMRGLPASRHILQPQYPMFRVFVGKSMIFVLTSDSFVTFSVCCWSHFPCV